MCLIAIALVAASRSADPQRSFRLAYVGAFVLVLVYAETPLVHLMLSRAGG